MAIFKIQNFKRNYECTNVVAIVADELPARFSPDVFKRDDAADLSNLTKLYVQYENGQRCEVFGYL